MAVKAIFAHAGLPYWIDAAAELRDKYGWKICYFIGSRDQKEKAAGLFPDAVFQTHEEARENLAPQGCKIGSPAPLDKDLLSALSTYESIFMKMMDRYNFDGSFTYLKRITAYHSQIMYWKGVLEHFRPDVVVFRIAPHAGHDYALYSLCRVMNIPTFMFERTSLPGFLYPVRSFEEGSGTIRKACTEAIEKENHDQVRITPESERYLDNLSKPFKQAMPFHLKYKLKHNKKEGDLGSTVSIFRGLAGDFVKAFLKIRNEPNYFPKKFHKRIGKYKRKKLLDCYRQLATEVDLDVPYIFVALQCEPERQTCPAGGVYGNQYLMIDLLSKLIPDSWKIYVKEHLSQFKKYQAAERAKSVPAASTCSPGSVWPTVPTNPWAGSRAASSSASPSAGPCCAGRPWSWRTSPPAASTTAAGARSWPSCWS